MPSTQYIHMYLHCLSPPQRSLSSVGRNRERGIKASGSWGEGKRKRAGATGKGQEKERDLCHIMCGSVARFAVLWTWPKRTINPKIINTTLKISV